MARTTLTVQTIDVDGVVVTTSAANADGSDFLNTGRECVEITNGSASPITLTVQSQVNCNQGYSHDEGGTIAAGATKRFGPFPIARFNTAAGKCEIDYSDVTTVTVAVVKIP